MVCPHCNTPMQEVTKTGVLIDLCPQCKSVWLDHGEPEKILAQARFEQRPRDYDDDDHDKRRSGSEGRYSKKRWTEIFDIFD